MGILVFVCLCRPADAAVYSSGQSDKRNITDLYRDMVVVECGESMYTANQFGSGYIGLAGSTNVQDHFVNFSIWDNGAGEPNYVVEGPDPRLGGVVSRFGNEGTGAKTTTKLRWEFDVLYKTYVKIEHLNGGTLYSGWIQRADTSGWYSCGRIFMPNSRNHLGAGTVFLETLSDHEGKTRRINGATLGWVRDDGGWAAMTGLSWSRQADKGDRASGYNTTTVHYLTFEQGNQAPWHPADRYQVPPGMIPTPATAPATMPAFTGTIKDIGVCPVQGAISKDNWRLLHKDSEETEAEDGRATNAFDGNPATYWHTQWRKASPPPPHEIQIDLGAQYSIDGFGCMPRQDSTNGAIDRFEFYVSPDGISWGSPIASGSWGGVLGICRTERFAPVSGRYVRLVALSDVGGNPWSSIAELNVYEAESR